MLYFYVESAKYSAYTDKRRFIPPIVAYIVVKSIGFCLLSQLHRLKVSLVDYWKGSHVQLSLGRRHSEQDEGDTFTIYIALEAHHVARLHVFTIIFTPDLLSHQAELGEVRVHLRYGDREVPILARRELCQESYPQFQDWQIPTQSIKSESSDFNSRVRAESIIPDFSQNGTKSTHST